MEKLLKLDETDDEGLVKEIKESLKLKFDDELFLFSGKDCLIIKKMKKLTIADRFRDLSSKVEKRFKNKRLKEGVVDEAIKWARK